MLSVSRQAWAFVRRLWAYLRGDFLAASAVPQELVEREGVVPWIEGVRGRDADYALEVTLRSASHAEAAADKLLDKASALVTVLAGLLALSLGATGVALQTQHDSAWIHWMSFAAFCFVDGLLVLAAMNAFLATSPAIGGGVNAARLHYAGDHPLDAAKRHEAATWHRSAMLAMSTVKRRADDVINARRFLLWAVIMLLPAAALTFVQTK